jgi:4-alpha-glucanotransferase
MKYSRGNAPTSGIVVALSALRTAASPACGEYPDLAALGKLAKLWNFNLIQLLPVNDSGSQSSPYSARSAFGLHPLYIRLSELPELSSAASSARDSILAESAALSQRFAGDERLRYGAYLEAKLELLRRVWDVLAEPELEGKSPRAAAEFAAWIGENPWVKAYALFSELKERNGGAPWWEWKEHGDASASEIEALWEEPELVPGLRFRAWLQWRAEAQFRAAASSLAALGIELMGDLPIMIDKDSAEVWARRSVFRLDLAAGAPPDMYAALGQNWGFPIYDWEAAGRDGYSFWKERLASAEKFYSAYRIDHVLGFFRIWSLSERERSGYLGRFVPDAYIERSELEALGFDSRRIRWMSEPHIRTADLVAAVGDDTEAMEAAELALERIGDEELYLFKRSVRGERDIEALASEGVGGYGPAGLSPKAREYLLARWRDRVLFEFEPGRFVPAWSHSGASAWPTLSGEERERLDRLFGGKRAEGESGWAANGRRLLGVLKGSSSMLPCAEDLGSVPACVPRVLGELGILGLRVLRWTRDWGRPGQPYVELADYPRLTVACPSVHDSSSLREWWEREADRGQVWAFVSRSLGKNLGSAPDKASPATVSAILQALALSGSALVVYPIQDLLALGERWRPADPSLERVNVPGTYNEWNWGWRLPAAIEEIAAEEGLAAAAKKVAAARKSG